MRTIKEIMFTMIRSEICNTELPADLKDDFTEDKIEKLYILSGRHDLAHFIADSGIKNNLFDNTPDIKEKYESVLVTSVYRYENLNHELTKICDLLEKSEIPFIPLKGSAIRKYYPEPWMRTSCDIDILVHEEDVEKAQEKIISELQYKKEATGNHDVSMTSPNGIHLELHFSTTDECNIKNSDEILCNLWDYTKVKNGSKYHFEITNEMFYFYHIAHMAKHIENGGCGIRPFIDLWIMDNSADFSKESCDELLSKGGLLEFAEVCRELSKIWINGTKPQGKYKDLENYVISGGTYGNVQNQTAVQQVKNGGKIKYTLSLIFVPYEKLKIMYPVIESHRILTPFYEVCRWFRIIKEKRAKTSMDKLSYNFNITNDQQKDMKEFLLHIGL